MDYWDKNFYTKPIIERGFFMIVKIVADKNSDQNIIITIIRNLRAKKKY